jgi:hypothetical protein
MTARSPDGHRVAVVTAAPVHQLGWPGMPVRIELRAPDPGRSLSSHQRLGTLTAVGTSTVHVPVVAAGDLSEPDLLWRLGHLP